VAPLEEWGGKTHCHQQHWVSLLGISLLHIVPFCEGPNKKSEGFAKEKQIT